MNIPETAILESLPSGAIILNHTGRVAFANTLAKQWLGEPLLEVAWLDVITRAFMPRADDGHEISLVTGQRLQVACNPLRKGCGQLILLTDQTATRDYQADCRMAEMGRMTAHLTHQIRTPVASALLWAHQLEKPGIDIEKISDIGRKIGCCLKSIESQIQDLLCFARGGESLLETTPVTALLARVYTIVEKPLADKNIILNMDNQCGDISIVVQAESLQGALVNLIDNASNACDTNSGKIEFSVQCQQGELSFCVKDNGCGMSNEVQAQICQPFFTTRAQGTGLGLAIVSAVAKAHRGTLAIESHPGFGTTMTLSLPFQGAQHAHTHS